MPNYENVVLRALQGKVETRTDYALSIHKKLIKLGETIEEHLLSFEKIHYKIATALLTHSRIFLDANRRTMNLC